MNTPGFTADESLFRSIRAYSTRRYSAYASRVDGISPQSECCNISCAGICVCENQIGKCSNWPPATMKAQPEYVQ